jgi:phosphate transport system protein
MERHIDVELNDLKNRLLLMGGSVESQLQDVLQALTERDSNLAIRVVENDLQINRRELSPPVSALSSEGR